MDFNEPKPPPRTAVPPDEPTPPQADPKLRDAAVAPAVRLKPGTTLVREWHGRTHTVLVLADGGFEHEGRRYPSLTRLARAITGAHWSGPRFFGLRRGTRSADARAHADRGGGA